MIYLDNAATTKISDSVLNAMMPYLITEYGNPGAIYSHGINARRAIENAREQVAKFMNCSPDQIVFTSSGSEGNNMIIKGVALKHMKDGFHDNQTVISYTEHESIFNSCIQAMDMKYSKGYTLISPDNEGRINPSSVQKFIDDKTGLVSVMYVNNEVGTINKVKEIADICHNKGVLFHTDCVQAAGFLNLDMKDIGCDFATISAHKLHGPKGVGAVYINDPSTIVPLISGSGSQEHGLRGGTENVAGIVGLGQACEDAVYSNEIAHRMSLFVLRFYSVLSSSLMDIGINDVININGNFEGKILNITVKGVDAQTLVLAMSSSGVCISAGSACCAHDLVPSRVLISMGLSEKDASSSVRISFSNINTFEEVEEGARIMAKNIAILLGVNANKY